MSTSKESLKMLMKKQNSLKIDFSKTKQYINPYQTYQNNSSLGLSTVSNKSQINRANDNSSIDVSKTENEKDNKKISSMVYSLIRENKNDSRSQVYLTQRRNLNLSTERSDDSSSSLVHYRGKKVDENRQTTPKQINTFCYHFPNNSNNNENINLLGPLRENNVNKTILGQELYFTHQKPQILSPNKGLTLNQSTSKERKNTTPVNQKNYVQYLEEFKKNFDKLKVKTEKSTRVQSAVQNTVKSHPPINAKIELKQDTLPPTPKNKTPKSQKQFSSDKNQKLIESQVTLKQQSVQSTQSQSKFSEDNQNFSSIQNLCLKKEELLKSINEMCQTKTSFAMLLPLLKKFLTTLIEITSNAQEKILKKMDENIYENLSLDFVVLYILTIELKKFGTSQFSLDMNLKNIVQYCNLSSTYVLEKLLDSNVGKHTPELWKKMQSRVLERLKQTGRKSSSKSRCSLAKNNDIVSSLASLMQKKNIFFTFQFSIEDSDQQDAYIKLDLKTKGPYQKRIQLMIQNLKCYYNEINGRNESEMTFPSVSNEMDLTKPQKQFYLKPQISNGKQYTLVLDLDETLVHYQEFEDGGGQFLVRPFAEEFLVETSKFYEIVIFTAALPDYANFILDIIDKQKVINYKLYREHTFQKQNIYIKDLQSLGRSLAKTIIVDNMPENFQLQPENGIFIKSWMGETNDRALKDLLPLLVEIVQKKCKDVRIGLKLFREQMIQRIQSGCKDPYSNLRLD